MVIQKAIRMITKILHKKIGDTIKVYCVLESNSTPVLEAIILDDNSLVSDIDTSNVEISEIFPGLFFATIPLQEVSSGYVLGVFGGGSFCVSMEATIPRVFFFNANQVDLLSETLGFTILDNRGSIMQMGTLGSIDTNFYQIVLGQGAVDADQFLVVLSSYDSISINSISDANNTNVPSRGTILLNSNVWQQIAIPVYDKNIKEEFCDRLAVKYNTDASNIIEICTAYFGSENKFRSYIPDVTSPNSSNNFPLIFTDRDSFEISGVWVKMKDLSSFGGTLLYEWGS